MSNSARSLGTGASHGLRHFDLVRASRVAAVHVVTRLRGRHLFVIDFFAVALAGYLALSMGYHRAVGIDGVAPFAPILVTVIAVRLLTNTRLGLYARGWRFASVPDLTRICLAVVVGTAISYLIVLSASVVLASVGLSACRARSG